ncbi:unnamed protein product (macronuclear) [Paramecium tetraurelia]|uniref:Uncharacterized protein n=1 Tax=Paramecium tetraurelia TaxID=5888 RepID=A0CFZ3_PARTE|nr:uncharacterized protein GSPATT00038152001 [Paramecium tetraurelia]CAK69710.1 unnamed protein product [Paramecium tetraurelia]|eukprot:XP_001437107.1 hypothetical protein (macronuclear) [Paramecium tetraurelia strain d4-2]
MRQEESESLTESQVLLFMNEKMREEGMLDRIKLQVRKEIVDKLMQEPKSKKPKRQFDLKVADCFVINFLQTQNFLCTAEIFIQECGLDRVDILQTQELLQLHGLTIRDYEQHLFQLQQGTISALEIMRSVIKRKYQVEKSDHSCQTDEREETYEQKMRNLENGFLKKVNYSRLHDMQTIEERMNNLRKDIEQKYQAKLEAEIVRLREHEMEMIRQEERIRYEKMLKQMKSGADEEYTEKLKELKKKEEDALIRINAKLKAIEQDKFEKQQEIQRQLHELEQEKIKYHRHKCLDSDVVKQELAEMDAIKLDLRKAMDEYKKSKESLDQQNIKQAEMLNEYWKEKIAKEREAKKEDGIDDETDWVKYQKDNCSRLQKQREYLLSENETLRQEINELNYKIQEVQKELDKCRNELMQAKDERDVEHNYSMRLEGQIRIITQINDRNSKI